MTQIIPSGFSATWVPRVDSAEFNGQICAAMQRIAGSIGLDLATDKEESAAPEVPPADTLGVEPASREPFCMHIGGGIPSIQSGSVGESTSLGEVASIIQREFLAGAEVAFRNAKSGLRIEAQTFLQTAGVDMPGIEAALEEAEKAFVVPGKDALAWEAAPLVNAVAMPATQALVGGFAGGVCFFLVSGMLSFAFFSGVLIGGTAYYLARARIRRKAMELLDLLPRRLYALMAGAWDEGVRRYADIVNAAVEQDTPRA